MGLFDLFRKKEVPPPSVQDSFLEKRLLFCRKSKSVYLQHGNGVLVVFERGRVEPNLERSTEIEVRKAMNWAESTLLDHVVDAVTPLFVKHINDKSDLAPYEMFRILRESETRIGRKVTTTGYRTLQEMEEVEKEIFCTVETVQGGTAGYFKFSIDDVARMKSTAERMVGSMNVGDFHAARAWFLEQLRHFAENPGFVTFVYEVNELDDNRRSTDRFVVVKAIFEEPSASKTMVIFECSRRNGIVESPFYYGVR